MRLSKVGISPAQSIGALTLLSIGILTYYVAPYAVIYSNVPLFFIVLTIVMIMMVIGFVLLGNLAQPYFEKFLLKVILISMPRERSLETIVRKNFYAHRERNTKTSIMFSLTLAFIIFAGTGFRLDAHIIVQYLQQTLGSDIIVKTLDDVFLNETNIRYNLEKFKHENPNIIKDYSFVSHHFSLQPYIDPVNFTSLAKDPSISVQILSIDSSYLNSVYEDYYVPTEFDPRVNKVQVEDTKKPDAAKALYSAEGIANNLTLDNKDIISNAYLRSKDVLSAYIQPQRVRFIIPKGLAIASSLSTKTSSFVSIGELQISTQIRCIASKMPGFPFTGYNRFWTYTVLTSHEDYDIMRRKAWALKSLSVASVVKETHKYLDSIPEGSSYNVAKTGLFIRYHKEVTDTQRLHLISLLETVTNSQYIFVIDVLNSTKTLQNSLVFIDVFFILVAIIAIALSFFFTVISFASNINENAWEFGVLRALGLNKKQMMLIYLLEALCLVLAASIIGTIIGVIVAVTSSSLFFFYTELPFFFDFPVVVFVITLLISILSAIVASKIAVDDVKDKQISAIIKSL